MKGLVFLETMGRKELFIRFAAGDAFNVAEAKHDLVFVAVGSDERSDREAVEMSRAGLKVAWVPFYSERFQRWQMLFDASCIAHNDASSSFAVRNQERARQKPAYYARLERFASPGIYEEFRKKVEQDMGLHPDILGLTLRERPDFFILPSGLLDRVTDDVLQVAGALGIPTLMLVAGWDNLSSKGLLYHKPTMMGVWGEQSKKHAVEVQGVDADRVFVVGAPHYQVFWNSTQVDRAAMREQWGVPQTGSLLLFAGTLRLFDETELLRKTEQAIESGALPPHHILYRPHPLRFKRPHERDFHDFEWRHVTMDPELAEAHQERTPDLSRMEHLRRLYKTVDAVVSPMSTVLLEALLFGLPTMAVAFGDGKHSWSADKVSRMLHFKELYEVPELIVCRDETGFFPQLRELLGRVGNGGLREKLKERTGYFVYQGHESYAERVASLLDTMLSRGEPKPMYDLARVRPGKSFATRHWLRSRFQWGSAILRRVVKTIR